MVFFIGLTADVIQYEWLCVTAHMDQELSKHDINNSAL